MGRKCNKCGRLFASNFDTKLECCNAPIRVKGENGKAPEDQRSKRVSRSLRVINDYCVSCENWSTVAGKSGCGKFNGTLCQSLTEITKGAGCHDTDNPRFPPDNSRNFFVSRWFTVDDLRADVKEFTSTVSLLQFDAIAGVPRSGMMVASDIAVRLGLPLLSVGPRGLEQLNAGLRVRENIGDYKKILVMEDSSASGNSIREARGWVGDRSGVLYGAIYATEMAASKLDIHHKDLELPHWFEWNMLGNPHLSKDVSIGIDFDGILCPDFTAAQDDDGDGYITAMETMPVNIHPGVNTVRNIITARLGKYRSHTVNWLDRHRIKFDRLTMGPWKSKDERDGHCIGSWKAGHCKKLGVQVFIESCPTQAKIIAQKARGTAVICPATKTTYAF